MSTKKPGPAAGAPPRAEQGTPASAPPGAGPPPPTSGPFGPPAGAPGSRAAMVRPAERVAGLDALFEATGDATRDRADDAPTHGRRPKHSNGVRSVDDETDDLAAAALAVRSTPGETMSLAMEPARVEYQTADGVPHTRLLLDATTVGRHTENDIQLLDPEVSKAHLVIRKRKDGFHLEDLGSANGTIVNGQRQAKHKLQDGDVVLVGNSTLRFRVERPRAPTPRPPGTTAPPAPAPLPAPAAATARPAESVQSARPAQPVRPAMKPPVGMVPQERAQQHATFDDPIDLPAEALPDGRPAEVSGLKPAPLSSFADMRKSDPIFGPGFPLPGFAAPARSSVVRDPGSPGWDTGPLKKPPSSPEHTSVTLVPEHLLSEPVGESVFAEQDAEVGFDEASVVLDEKALRRDYERLRVAFDLFTNVGMETDLEALGQTILQKIRGVLPADTAVVMLRDPGISDDLVTLASWSDRGTAVQIPRAIVERVLVTKSGLLTSDAQVDTQLRRSETIVGARIRSALCVPLVVRGEVLGVIHLSSNSVAGAYEEKDLSLLRAIAQPAALAVANARLRRKIEEEAATRAELSRFLSPALVEKAVRNELDFGKAGDKVQCTVLFSDIRGFTTISDGAAPEQVVSMLNEYFDAMVEVVFEHGGTLDKFLGDGLMAVWGTPIVAEDDAYRAVRAAQAMRTALADIVNAARTSRNEEPLHVGFGIATGRVVAGAMGARRRLDFTVIGDTVNLASRLCGQARAGQILIDELTDKIIKQAGVRTAPLEARLVKGFARPVPVFDVDVDLDVEPQPQTDPIGDRFGDKTPAGGLTS